VPSCGGVVRVPRRVFQRLLPARPTPEQCVDAYYLHPSSIDIPVEVSDRSRMRFFSRPSRSIRISVKLLVEDVPGRRFTGHEFDTGTGLN
jgi:hypothetical protein